MSLKIPIFQGVNDNPLAPNEVNNANADYFIDRFNKLTGYVRNELTIENSLGSSIISFDGLDTNTGLTLESPITIERFSELNITKYFKSGIRFFLTGSFSELNLIGLNANFFNIYNGHTPNTVSINGPIKIDANKYVQFGFYSLNKYQDIEVASTTPSISGVINWNINSTINIDLKGSILHFKDNKTIFTRNNNSQFNFRNGTLVFENTTFNNTNQVSNFFNCENCNIYINGNLNISSTVDFKLFNTTHDCNIYIDGFNVVENNSIVSTVFNSNNSNFILVDAEISYENNTIIQNINGDYNINSVSKLFESKYIRDRLENLPEEEKLDASALKNLNEISPNAIRDKLSSLTGDNRLSVSAIKDINYINYYTSTTLSYTQPVVNNLVTIGVVNSSFLGVGNYILIQDGGVYKVETIVNSTSISVRNLGYSGYPASGSQIQSGKLITITGKSGISVISYTTENFILPEIGSTVSIKVDSVEPFLVGSVILVNNIDFFRVNSTNVSTLNLNCERLGYYTHVNPGTTVVLNTKISLAGLKGERGYSNFTQISSDFTVPNIFESGDLRVDSSIIFNNNTFINIEDSGTFYIESIDNDTKVLSVKNLGYDGNLEPESIVPLGKKVVNVGGNGRNSYTFTIGDIVAPEYNSPVDIKVGDIGFLTVGLTIKLGTNAFFKILSIDSINNIITSQFLDYSTLLPNETILSNTLVVLCGEIGKTGDTGAPGLSSFTNFQPFTVPNINESVLLQVDSNSQFIEGQNVFVEGAGHFLVESLIDSNILTIRNFGFFGNALPGTSVLAGKVGYAGKQLNGYYGEFVGTFTMPAIDDTEDIISLLETEWLNVNNLLFLPTIGYLRITAINDATKTITVKNEFYSENSPESTTYVNGRYYLVFGHLPTDIIIGKVKSQFAQPAINNNVSVNFYTTKWLNPGMIISGQESGHYEVISIIDSANAILKNLGYGFNNELAQGENILSGVEFKNVGPRGPVGYNPTYSFLSANFTQPDINSNVLVSVNDTSWMVAGQGLSIQGGGPNYSIVSIDSATDITVKNLGYENSNSGVIINGSGTQLVTPAGIRGKDSSSFVVTTANFTQPAANANVTISVNRTDTINPFSILVGENCGYYRVVSIGSSTSITIKNLNYPTTNTALPTTLIASGEKLTISGEIGPIAYNATYSNLLSNFTQPAISSTVQITINDTSWISSNQYIYIAGGGTYEVISVDSGTTLTVKNLGDENTVAGATITGSGTQKVSPAGRRGLNGSVSSATFLSLLNQTSNPISTLNSVNLFSKLDQSLYTIDTNGIEHKINQDLVIGNSLNNIIGISSNSGINGINLGSSNVLFGTNSLINIGSNGTLASGIILADELNTNKITIKSPLNSNLLSSYSIELPNDIGTNGYALVTDGIGKTSWQEIKGGTLSSITDGITSATEISTINFTSGATVTQDGTTANIEVSGGTLQSVTDGITTVTDVTSINFTKGTVITQNETTAEIEVKGGGLEAIYTNNITYNALPNTLIITGPATSTINLPLNPENGVKVSISDYNSRFDISPITISAPSGNTIYDSSTLVLDTKYATVQLVYWNQKWVLYGTEIFSDTTGAILPPNTGTLLTELKSDDFIAVEEYLYLVDSSLGSVTATLPENPANGTKIAFSDFSQSFSTNNLIINPGGTNTIDGTNQKIISAPGTIELVFYNGKWTTITSGSGGGDLSTSLQVSFFYN